MKGLLARGPAPVPAWTLFLRIAILVFCVIILGLTAWGLNVATDDLKLKKRQDFDLDDILDDLNLPDFDDIPTSGGGGGSFDFADDTKGALIFVLFMTLWTAFGIIAITVFERFLPKFFFRIGALIALVLNSILLLSAWAFCADVASDWADAKDAKGPFEDMYNALAASAGLGALLWILVTVFTVFFVMASLKSPEGTTDPTAQTTQLESMPPKQEPNTFAQQPAYGQPVPQQQPYPVQQPYPAQPGYPQQPTQ